LNVVELAGEPLPAEVGWLLVGGTALVLLSIALLIRIVQVAEEHQAVHRTASTVVVLSSVVIVLLGLANLSAIPLLAALVVVLLAPVLCGLKVWPETFGADAGTHP
jgi:hypothetical protein